MKQRFSGLDVAAIVNDLRGSILNLRLQNVYDINPRTFLLKFAKPDLKETLLIESGIRVHTTAYARDKSASPGFFATKLRKYLKSKRLCEIRQFGMDRIMDLTFGENEFAFHLVLEFYASGNIILTDHDWTILAILRVVEVETIATAAATEAAPVPAPAPAPAPAPEAGHAGNQQNNEKDINFRVGEKYTMMNLAKPFVPIDEARLRAALDASGRMTADPELAAEDAVPAESAASAGAAGKAARKKKAKFEKSKKETGKELTLKRLLREKFGPDYGPALVDHAIAHSGVDPTTKMVAVLGGEVAGMFEKLLAGFKHADSIVLGVVDGSMKGGWITSTIHNSVKLAGSQQENLILYEEFIPYLFDHLPTSPEPIGFPSFDKATDIYFSHIESQKLSLRARQAEQTAQRKLENVKQAHENQIKGLEHQFEKSTQTAATLESNAELVETVLSTIRDFVASGIDWVDLWELIKEETRKKNPVASCIVGLKLEVSMITLQLLDVDFVDKALDDDDEDSDLDSDADDELDVEAKAARGRRKAERAKRQKELDAQRKAAMLKMDVDIYASAFANAARYYGTRKQAAIKAEKTAASATKALKSAERKINADLKQAKSNVATIRTVRKPYWFEKFVWFISSENYLVVGARDSQQIDLLVKKYMKKGDVIVGSEEDGASVVLVKNLYVASGDGPPGLTPDHPIPPLTLQQAGTMAICYSSAWEAKRVMGGWWVTAENVSKRGAGGTELATGLIEVKGKKNFLPPAQLIYGFGLLFRVGVESMERHRNERRPWARGELSSTNSVEELDIDVTNLEIVDDKEGDPIDFQEESHINLTGTDGSFDLVTDVADGSDAELVEAVSKEGIVHVKDEVGDIDGDGDEDEEVRDDDDEEKDGGRKADTSQGEGSVPVPRKHVSAKQRRDLKKKGPRTDGPEDDDNDTRSIAPSTTISTSKNANEPAPRGKRSKLKKAKDKYADQDESDKEAMMELLSSSKAPQPKGKRAKAKEEAKAQEKPKPATRPRVVKEKAEPEAELVEEDEEDLTKDLNVLGMLTAQPDPEDVIDAVIPVCAPWQLMSKYKYKLKLIPGSLKKGKAAKAAMTALAASINAQDPLAPKEKELMEAVPEAELIATILGKVKILAVGESSGGKGGGGPKKKGR
ncbi:hypothetical protein HK101_007892 [Irineochytrium annulatum]|nr:hypothetical protein HK101_007892 [Irineochytrium annulatum]